MTKKGNLPHKAKSNSEDKFQYGKENIKTYEN